MRRTANTAAVSAPASAAVSALASASASVAVAVAAVAVAVPRPGLLTPRPGLSREESFQEPGFFGAAFGCALATASTARFASRSKVRKESAWVGHGGG